MHVSCPKPLSGLLCSNKYSEKYVKEKEDRGGWRNSHQAGWRRRNPSGREKRFRGKGSGGGGDRPGSLRPQCPPLFWLPPGGGMAVLFWRDITARSVRKLRAGVLGCLWEDNPQAVRGGCLSADGVVSPAGRGDLSESPPQPPTPAAQPRDPALRGRALLPLGSRDADSKLWEPALQGPP